jgi:hypothetical protein
MPGPLTVTLTLGPTQSLHYAQCHQECCCCCCCCCRCCCCPRVSVQTVRVGLLTCGGLCWEPVPATAESTGLHISRRIMTSLLSLIRCCTWVQHMHAS